MEMTGFYLQMINSRAKTSQFQKVEFFQEMKEHVDFVLENYEKYRDGNKLMPGVSTSYIHAALMSARASGSVSDKVLENFIRVLVSGITRSQKEGIIIRQLRDKIQSNRHASIGGAMRVEFFLRTQKVLKNYIDNKPNAIAKNKKVIYFVPETSLPKSFVQKLQKV